MGQLCKLRISDLRRLELGDIDWRAKQIRIVQQKTGRPLRLPLLADVGWAIIDYVRRCSSNIGTRSTRLQKPPRQRAGRRLDAAGVSNDAVLPPCARLSVCDTNRRPRSSAYTRRCTAPRRPGTDFVSGTAVCEMIRRAPNRPAATSPQTQAAEMCLYHATTGPVVGLLIVQP